MGRKEVLARRKELEKYYYNCKLKTGEDVAKLFETYTRLIWEYHQAGLVYDYYSDETTLHHEGRFKEIGGVDVTTQHTIPSLAGFPRNKSIFLDIFGVGNEKEGFRFGQVTANSGVYPEEAYTSEGFGTGEEFQSGSALTFCECVVKKVNGRWVVDQEYLVFGEEVVRRRKENSRPFFQTVLDAVQGPPCDCCECEEDFEEFYGEED